MYSFVPVMKHVTYVLLYNDFFYYLLKGCGDDSVEAIDKCSNPLPCETMNLLMDIHILTEKDLYKILSFRGKGNIYFGN